MNTKPKFGTHRTGTTRASNHSQPQHVQEWLIQRAAEKRAREEVLELSQNRQSREDIAAKCREHGLYAPGLVSRLFRQRRLTATQWYAINPMGVRP